MPNLNAISPCFIVTDFDASIGFYTGWLGFEIWYIGPESDPYFAVLGRDGVSIMIKALAGVTSQPNRLLHDWAPWDAYIDTDGASLLYEEYQLKGVKFTRELSVDDDNLLGFEVADPDGYILFFGKPV